MTTSASRSKNPQVNFLDKHSLAEPLFDDINNILSTKRGEFFTSYEISKELDILKSPTYKKLKTLLAKYPQSPFSSAPTHIGSLCSYLTAKEILKHTSKHCSVLGTEENAFALPTQE